ncbi:MAG: hypothetical protein EBQ86_02245 [Betaproteobacteria bacterium]|nr:hypothetical protein [Betaproteobacteria bacterium]
MNKTNDARFGGAGLRSVWAIDERQTLVAWVQTPPGKIALLVLAFLSLNVTLQWQEALFDVAAMALFAYWPQWRSVILFVATYVTAFIFPHGSIDDAIRGVAAHEGFAELSTGALSYVALVGFLFLAWGLLAYARYQKQSVLAQRPLLTLLAIELLLCLLTYQGVLHGLPRLILWSLLCVLTPYFWFLAYALVDQRSKDRSSDLFQLGTFHPLWGGVGSVPVGKGAAFLRKMLAKTPKEMAITQIKAVKLLLWADALLALRMLLKWFFEDYHHIPSVTDAIDASIQNHAYALCTQWASLIWSVINYSLRVSISGHFIIGSARLAGFRLPRATWRPLESRTLIEYFNRFSYYFKELLVDFFFLPTFFRVFKEHPRVRLFFATFMAAGVGNAIYHFVCEIDLVESMGLSGALESYISYAFYCLILATGIGISQVRASSGHKPSSSVWGRIQSFFVVWGFVTLLHIFSDESRNHTFSERAQYLLSMFAI